MQVVNAEGLSCPQPLLKAKQALNKLNSGDRLRITATDPASKRDFQVFAEHLGHNLVCKECNGIYTYIFIKSSA